MTKNEALKAAIDGRKIKSDQMSSKETYVYFEGNSFKVNNPMAGWTIEDYVGSNSWHWQILPELVSFAEAWKALTKGKTIKPQKSSVNVLPNCEHWISTNEIKGKWQILDD